MTGAHDRPPARPGVAVSAPENPAAFPVPMIEGFQEGSHGMSLRDYFAGQALAGITSNYEWLSKVNRRGSSITATAAGSAYEFADAMLAERAKVRS